ncbi:hypothetical protein LTR08_003051 [Meristemomyces frigidus]|nr:hypothetical protein LTR08_003051 [Meristemomyces frigidus]
MLSQTPTTFFLALASAAAALAQQTQSAGVTIEASHGGASSDLTNTTITIPLNTTYTNTALSEVSYLFLTSATGVPIESITCTPHLYANGTGDAGLPFTSDQPSLLSTNTVQVGSITCVSAVSGVNSSSATTTAVQTPTSTLSSSLSVNYTSTLLYSVVSGAGTVQSTPEPATSTFVTTMTAPSVSQRSTVTSVMMASDSGSAPNGAGVATAVSAGGADVASSTSSASASLSTGNAAGKLSLAEVVWPGLAIGALGLAMAV